MILDNVLYDALPFLYTTGGATALLLSHDDIGRTSGVLLISAAMLIFHLRLEYRTRKAAGSQDTPMQAQLRLEEVKARQ